MITQTNYTTPAISTGRNRQIPATESASSGDKMSFSQTMRELSQSSASSVKATGMGKMSEWAHADPALAEKFASEFAFGIDLALVDISKSDMRMSSGAKYVATGEPITEESQARFAQETNKVREGKISLYQSEKAKGTPDADILDKLISFMDTQPEKYLRMIDWQRVSGRAG